MTVEEVVAEALREAKRIRLEKMLAGEAPLPGQDEGWTERVIKEDMTAVLKALAVSGFQVVRLSGPERVGLHLMYRILSEGEDL